MIYTNENIDMLKCKKIDKIIIGIILFMIIIIPNLVYIIDVVTIAPKVVHSSYNTGYKLEMFNLCKLRTLCVFTFIIFILFMYKLLKLKYELKNTNLNKVLFIMTVAIILSPLISDYKYISIIGNTDRFEGAIAWICYSFLFFVLYNTNIEKKQLKLFYFALIPFLLINSIMGVLDFYGIDILHYNIVNLFINNNNNATGRLMTTLYNPNFSSGLAGTIFVMCVIYLVLEENVKNKIILLTGSMLSFVIVLTSLSSSGFLTLSVLTPIGIFIVSKFLNKKSTIVWLSIVLISNGIIFTTLQLENNRIYEETFGFFERVINIDLENRNIWNSEKRDNDLFSKMDSLSTGRVHIWKKTVKLLKEKPLLGYGFDTYPYEVDNRDSANSFIDKPHNWYLTVWYGCGIIGLIGLIGIIYFIVKKSTKMYIKNINNKMLYVTATGVVAYAFQGMFNDSFIGTSIVFWIFAGVCSNIIISN